MRKALGLLFVFVLLVGGWTVAWFQAAAAAGRGLDEWRSSEAVQGRVWTCPRRAIGGFPFAITIDCSDATFTGRSGGPDIKQGVEGSVAHLTADVSLAHPRSLLVTLVAPFAYKTSDGTTVSATWSHLDLVATPLPHPIAVALHGSDVDVEGVFGGAGQWGGKAARLDTTFAQRLDTRGPDTRGPDTRGQDVQRQDTAAPSIDVTVALAGMDVPPLDDLMGGTDPVAIDVAGRVNRAFPSEARTPEAMIDAWRRGGGTIDIAQAIVLRGTSKMTLTGTLRLDDAHRPQGRLAAQLVGLEPLLQRFGISGNVLAAGSLLGTLFGGTPPTAPTEPGALALPIVLKNGGLAVGPIRTPLAVPPLY